MTEIVNTNIVINDKGKRLYSGSKVKDEEILTFISLWNIQWDITLIGETPYINQPIAH